MISQYHTESAMNFNFIIFKTNFIFFMFREININKELNFQAFVPTSVSSVKKVKVKIYKLLLKQCIVEIAFSRLQFQHFKSCEDWNMLGKLQIVSKQSGIIWQAFFCSEECPNHPSPWRKKPRLCLCLCNQNTNKLKTNFIQISNWEKFKSIVE